MPDYVVVASGVPSVSPQVFIARPYPFAVFVPSLSPASEVRVQFAQTSGAGGIAGDVFSDLQRVEGGITTAIYSGAGPGWGFVEFNPTPFARISLVASQTSVRTVGFYTMAQYRV
jgi:hypothetical protein